jgi:hypothetical protein
MKKIYTLIILATLLLAGCGSSKKQLEHGNYDGAIQKAVKALRKDASSEKDIVSLEKAMNIATDQDNERIRYLKIEGKASSWDEIYSLYKKMNDRQALVRTVTPLQYQGRTIEFPYVDYLTEMAEAKRKAADFYYAHGQELMKTGTKDSYRQAYSEFARAKDYIGDYQNIDAMLSDARYYGISRVFIALKNNSQFQFPSDFEKDLLNIDVASLNTDWVEYYTTSLDASTSFDYVINVYVKNIAVSPDNQVQLDSLVKREVEDGFSYVLDSKGNVTRDSLGNDIKVKKYKTLQCALIQTIQRKECVIDGLVEVVSLRPEKVIKTDPIGARSGFEHISARGIGDPGALSDRQKAMLNSKPVEFPNDIEMIDDCSQDLKKAIKGAIKQDAKYIY